MLNGSGPVEIDAPSRLGIMVHKYGSAFLMR
jgi:hypothetical protein